MDGQNIIDAHPGQTWPEGHTITTEVENSFWDKAGTSNDSICHLSCLRTHCGLPSN